MMHDIRKSGIPVLVYPTRDAEPLLLSLMFRFNEVRATASLLLRSALFVEGHDDRQTFVLQYDADNMKPGRSALGPADIALPQQRLDNMSREGNPQIRTLSLKLKKACPVWCPASIGAVRPKPDHETAYRLLVSIAKSTGLCILFDYNWLHRDHHSIFQRLVNRPEQLAGFPIWRHYSKQYRREDWSVFNADDDNATTEDEVAIGDSPPVYVEGAKRSRHVTPTLSSPPRKRVLLSPFVDVLPSPTEKDSIATPSPKPVQSSADPNPRFPPLATLTPELLRSGAAATLYHVHSSIDLDSPGQKPASSAASNNAQSSHNDHPDLEVVEQAVSAMLPNMLDTLLPTLLPRILAAASHSPAPSFQSMESQLSTAPFPPVLSALGVSLGEHMTHRIESSVQSLYAHAISHANYLRNAADAEFFEEREGERLAFERIAEVKYAEFQEQIEECGESEVERTACRVDELGTEAIAKVARVSEREKDLEQEREGLKAERAELRAERAELRLEKEELRRDKRELRADKEDLRRRERALQREVEVLQAAKVTATRLRNHGAGSVRAGSVRAGSAPA